MPCDSIILNRVELGKLDGKLLLEALKEMGAIVDRYGIAQFYYQGSFYQVINGKLVFEEGRPNIADLVKRHYGVATIKQAAKLKGWQVKKVGDFKYQVVRRAL